MSGERESETILTLEPTPKTTASRPVEWLILAVMVPIYLVIAALYAIKTPAWQIPDEPAHYNYVAQVVKTGAIPSLQPGDWNSAYLESIKSQKFAPVALGDQLGNVRYEDHQPPLFYLLEAPVYALTGGSLIAMRLFSVLIGAGVIVIAFLIVRTLFPAQSYVALATAGFIAFLPQHVAMMAGVDNDSLAELLIGLTTLACIVYLGGEKSDAPAKIRRQLLLIGVLLGLALVTKATAYLLVGIVIATIGLRALRERPPLGKVIVALAYAATPALTLGGFWWLHNFGVYGFPDFLGLRRHDAVVIGQARTADLIAKVGLSSTLSEAVQTTFHSFWGQFGWMGVLLPANIYAALVVFTALIVIGAVIAAVRFRRRLSAVQRDGVVILGVLALAALAEIIYYNLSFEQFQGRYLYPGLIGIAFFFAVGLIGWLSLIPLRTVRWGAVAVMLAFALFDIYALFRVILPALSV